MKNLYHQISITVTCFVFCLLPLGLFAQNLQEIKTLSPDSIFIRSWKSTSASEKVYLRGYLAKNYPNTQEGMFAKAYILGSDDQEAASFVAYTKCMEKYPNFLYAWYNYGADIKDSVKKLVTYKYIIDKDLSFNHYNALRQYYITLYEDIKDTVKANSELDRYCAKISDSYIRDFIDGLKYQYDIKDKKQAVEAYRRAVQHTDASFEAYQKLIDLELSIAEANEESTEDKAAMILQYAQQIIQNNQDEGYKIGEYVADKLKDNLNANDDAYNMYMRYYDTHPTAELVKKIVEVGNDLYINDNQSKERELLQQAVEDMPNNPLMLRLYASFLLNNYLDTTSLGYCKQALANCYTHKDSMVAMVAMTDYYEAFYQYDKAIDVYKKVQAMADTNNWQYGNVELWMARDYGYMGDYDKGKKYLSISRTKKRERKDINEDYYTMAMNDFDFKANLYDDKAKFDKANTFQSDWFKQFGRDCLFDMGFTKGGEKASATAQTQLDKLGAMLSGPNASKYLVMIRTFITDDDTSKQLAASRANWISNYLRTKYHIAYERFRMEQVRIGYNCKNINYVGKAAIIPVGDLQDVTPVVTTDMNYDFIATSPDGKYIAYGTNPVELWDVGQKVKVKELVQGNQRKFSVDGRYLAIAGSVRSPGNYYSNTLYIYDVKTGELYREKSFDGSIVFDWSPDGKQIAFIKGLNKLSVYDVASNTVLNTTITGDQNAKGPVWLKCKDLIATGERATENVRIWDAKTLELVKQLEDVSWTHAIGQSHDGKYLVVADNHRMLTCYNTDTWEMRQQQMPVLSLEVDASPTSEEVILNDWGGGDHPKMVQVNLDDLTFKTLDVDRNFIHYDYSADGSVFYKNGSDMLEIYNSSNATLIDSITAGSMTGWFAFADTSKGLYVTFDQGQIAVWNVRTGKKIHYWDVDLNYAIKPSEDASVFYGFGFDKVNKKTVVSEFDLNTFSVKNIIKSDVMANKLIVDSNNIILAGTHQFDHARDAVLKDDQGFVEVYNRKNHQLKKSWQLTIPTDRIKYKLMYSDFKTMALDSQGRKLAVVTEWMDGFSMGMTQSRKVRVYNIATGEKINEFEIEREFEYISFEGGANANILDLMADSYGWKYDVNTGDYKGYIDHGNKDYSFDLKYKSAKVSKVYNNVTYTANKFEVNEVVPRLVNLSVFETRNLAVTYQANNTIVFYDLDQFKKQLTITNANNNEWLAIKPSGEYECSLHGADRAYWVLGDNYLPFNALKDQLENPNLIYKTLDTLARRYAISRAQRGDGGPKISPVYFRLPFEVTVVGADQKVVATSDSVYILVTRIKRLDKAYDYPKIELKRDGRDFVEDMDPVITSTDDSMTVKYKVKMRKGTESQFEVFMVASNLKILSAEMKIRSMLNSDYTPSLWYLGIGVSNYQLASQKLSFADNDVHELAKVLQGQEGKLYSQVHVKTLCNDSATTRNIKTALWDYLIKAQDQDLIVIHLSGHGVQNDNGELFFVEYEGDMREPEATCFSIEELQRFLRSKKRPPNQKVLLLLDMCHSGGALSNQKGIVDIQSDDVIKSLSEGTGCVIITSSKGQEVSFEDKSFGGGHGAFSYAVIEALEGKCPKREDGSIYLSDFSNYVVNRVPQIVHSAGFGDQNPKININNLNDFPIATLKGN